jgi:hypothetical protein
LVLIEMEGGAGRRVLVAIKDQQGMALTPSMNGFINPFTVGRAKMPY